ncbi:unnamed protein product [Discula destructiva]
MVYCGKASLGCSGCRKRRIKCDRKQPECTQCMRLRKACPGYRDQLSLMFRDETVKVEKRVRASWGLDNSPTASTASACSKGRAKPTTPPGSSRRTAESGSIPTPPSSIESTSPVSSRAACTRSESPPLLCDGALQQPKPDHSVAFAPVLLTPYQYLGPTPSESGVAFYVEHYLLGYPDEVRDSSALSGSEWFRHPAAQTTMAALGLAAMGNLHNDKRLQHLSKKQYGEALVKTNEALQDPVKNLETAIRATVMLALFQCVHMTHEAHDNARVHIMGCIALIKATMPIRSAPAMGVRGVLQLCFSLLIPCVDSGVPMPDNFFASIHDSITSGFLPDDERPAVALIHVCARFANLSAAMRSSATAATAGGDDDAANDVDADVMRELLSIDAALDAWQTSQQGKWRYTTHTDSTLPPEAVFRQTYHRYSDVWTSRIWSHCRWTRLLTAQMLLRLCERRPAVAAAVGVVSRAQQDRCYETIRRQAADVLTSVPTHYKHPRLTYRHLDAIQTHGGAGAGAVGIPHLMFHLQVAACAPGVPVDMWQWAVDLMENTWGELGMLHAKSLAELSRKHRAMSDFGLERKLKFEPVDF